jgi:hypothetical protein
MDDITVLDQMLGPFRKMPFLWVNRKAEEYAVEDMATKHLLHSARMIWNHVAPNYLRIHPWEKHEFKEHSLKYLLSALVIMYHELGTREDLNDYGMNTLQRMADRAEELKKYHIALKKHNDSGSGNPPSEGSPSQN